MNKNIIICLAVVSTMLWYAHSSAMRWTLPESGWTEEWMDHWIAEVTDMQDRTDCSLKRQNYIIKKKWIAELNGDIHKYLENGLCELHCAVVCNEFDRVTNLVEQGVCIDIRSSEGLTPLYLAVLEGNLVMVQFLVKNGADSNVENNEGISPRSLCISLHSIEENYTQLMVYTDILAYILACENF